MKLENMPPEIVYAICDFAEKTRMSPERAFRFMIHELRIRMALKDYFDSLPN